MQIDIILIYVAYISNLFCSDSLLEQIYWLLKYLVIIEGTYLIQNSVHIGAECILKYADKINFLLRVVFTFNFLRFRKNALFSAGMKPSLDSRMINAFRNSEVESDVKKQDWTQFNLKPRHWCTFFYLLFTHFLHV